ncbi:MAG: hypothetical protein WCJ26_08830 [bacterium]
MKIFQIIFLCVILVLLISCKKSEEPNPVIVQNPNYLLSIECKKWTMFQPGSYWVYLNEKTQSSDCTYYKHGLYYNKENYYNGIHEYNWFFVNSNMFIKFSLAGGENGNSLTVDLPKFQNLIALTQKSLADSVTCDSVPGIYTYTLVEKLPFFTLNGNNYTNVVHTKCRYQKSDKYAYDFYWAKNIGIIYFKKNYELHDTAWSLARWYVNQ